MEPDVPATVKELKRWMKQRCFNFNSYSIHGNTIYEGFGIDTSRGVYTWYYTERGQRHDLEYFSSEQEIVLYAFNKIESDSWARTHMIGFGGSEKAHEELAAKLIDLGIEFLQDSITNFYAVNHPAYRTFVYGCDVHKVGHLKKVYFKEKRII